MKKANTTFAAKVVYLTLNKDVWVIVPTTFLPFFLDMLLKKIFRHVTTEDYVWPTAAAPVDSRPEPTNKSLKITTCRYEYKRSPNAGYYIIVKTSAGTYQHNLSCLATAADAKKRRQTVSNRGSIDTKFWTKL